MTKSTHPVLCGGTFFTLLVLSRKPTVTRRQRTSGKSDAFSESDMLLGLVKIIQPDYLKPAGNTFKTYTTNYKKCDEYTPDDLKFNNTSVMSAFSERMNTDYSNVLLMSNHVITGLPIPEDIEFLDKANEVMPPERISYSSYASDDGDTVYEAMGWELAFKPEEVYATYENEGKYNALMKMLDSNDFEFKAEYFALFEYYKKLKSRYANSGYSR